jgi:hypothetical protein
MKRAALLIGLDNASQFPPLKAAVSGAKAMRNWLEPEGYTTTLLTDEAGSVSAADVKSVLRSIIQDGDTEKLVVYFAGHGLLNGFSELWMLSNAMQDVDEVIDISKNVEAARTCGVKSVVFISDACRLLPSSVSQSRTSGVTVFPMMNDHSVDVEVDRFFATRPGAAALELNSPIGTSERERYVGIFTEALRDMHVNPDAQLTGPVTIDGNQSIAVLSRKLKASLPQVVDARAQDKSLSLKQHPQFVLECGDDGYVARAIITKAFGAGKSVSKIYRDTVTLSTNRVIINDFSISVPLREEMRFRDLRARTGPLFESTERKLVGATVIGRAVANVWCKDALVAWDASGPISEIRLRATITHISSVVIYFEDGSGAVVAIIPRHHTTVTVGSTGISNVLFEPCELTASNPEGPVSDYAALASEISAAVNFGIFPESRDDAKSFALHAAPLGNPTLALYSAMGLVEVGLRRFVNLVVERMGGAKSSALFDLCQHTGQWNVDAGPFCPLLSQTWIYLDNEPGSVPDSIAQAGRNRQPSLWTTFTPEGMSFIEKAKQAGELEWQRN